MIDWARENFNESGRETEDGYSFERSWTIHTTAATDDAYRVLDAANIPRIGEAHPSGRAVATDRDAHHHEGSDLDWEVTVTYTKSPDPTPGSGGDTGDNRPVLVIGAAQVTEIDVHDRHSVPLTNSAGDAFSNGDQTDRSRLTITISKQLPFSVLVPSILNTWKDTVHGPAIAAQFVTNPRNFAVNGVVPTFFGFGNFIARLVDFGATTVAAGKDTEWSVNVRFSLADSWLGTALDQGVYENRNALNSLSPGQLAEVNLQNRKPIIDFHGMPVARPVLLNGRGFRLTTGAPWYRVWQKHPHGDLNALLAALTLPNTWNAYRIVRP